MSKSSLNDKAKEILKLAEEQGVEKNYFFVTTFKRYQFQLKILDDLEKSINKSGTLVTKEYVKGRENVYSHPAVSDYNRTTDSANKTVNTLIKIVSSMKYDSSKKEDPLLKIMNGE